jgi:spectinomycin phosphotransferase
MLEKPVILDEQIAAGLRAEYGLDAREVTFLPLGADQHTAVYRITTREKEYFFKLRSGGFEAATVTLPRYLYDLGIPGIIPPLPTASGSLWGSLQDFKTILFPFITGRNGYEARLSDCHWLALGQTLKGIHAAAVPPALGGQIARETYAPGCRETVQTFLTRVERETFSESVAAQTAALLREQRPVIEMLLLRANRLALTLAGHEAELVLCHADLHAGNLLIGTDGRLYLVDWDTLMLAPRERDLMYIGAGLLGDWYTPAEEVARFYPAYGAARVSQGAIAYYRYERILQDIAAFCEQLLLSDAGGDDRAQSLTYLESNFQPRGTIEIACQADDINWPGNEVT